MSRDESELLGEVLYASETADFSLLIGQIAGSAYLVCPITLRGDLALVAVPEAAEGLTGIFVGREYESKSIEAGGALTWPFCSSENHLGLANSMGLFSKRRT